MDEILGPETLNLHGPYNIYIVLLYYMILFNITSDEGLWNTWSFSLFKVGEDTKVVKKEIQFVIL